MIATFTSAGWRDFNQRYANVFGYFPKEDGTDVLVYMEKVGETRCTFRDREDLTYYAQADMGVNFKFIPITKKVFLYNGMPHLAQRVPARQYRRGICGDNTKITSILSGRSLSVDFAMVQAYTEKPDNSGKHKVFDDIFVITQAGNLCIYDHCVGSIEGSKVTLTSDIFKQEILDLFRRNNLEYTIV